MGGFMLTSGLLKTVDKKGSLPDFSPWQKLWITYLSDSQSEAKREICGSLSEPASALPACLLGAVGTGWLRFAWGRDLYICVSAEKSREQPCMMLAIWRYEWLHGTVAVHSSSCPSSRKVGRNSCRGQRRAEILSFVNIYYCCQKLPLWPPW